MTDTELRLMAELIDRRTGLRNNGSLFRQRFKAGDDVEKLFVDSALSHAVERAVQRAY